MAQPIVMRHLHEVAASVHSGKITPPRPGDVRRPALVRWLNAAKVGRLTLVVAPAGWGKSSMLAEWAAQADVPVAWMLCDEVDDQPMRFARTLASAVERARPGAGADLLALARSPRVVGADELLAVLLASIADDPAPLAIVLDQFDCIGNEELLAAVREFIASAPPHLHTTIAGRTVPAWSMARWRASGQVTELGIEDLAFSIDEVAALLGASTRDEGVQVLHARSEGWAAGIRLAALWTERSGSRSDLASCFRGTHRDVVDYLSEEVFADLPGELQRFLLETSVLDDLSASLCQAVTGNDAAAELLDQIEMRGLFLIPIDTERRGYRYHAIFREFLQDRLERSHPGRSPELLCRAAAWYEREGNPATAAEYALRSGDLKRSAVLLDGAAERLLLVDGEISAFLDLVEHLPAAARRDFPRLRSFHAWALSISGNLYEAEHALRALEEDLTPPDRARAAEIAGIRARIAAYKGDHDGTIRQAREALGLAADGQASVRADALLSLGFAHRATGEIDAAANDFGEVSRIGWQHGLPYAACWGSRYRALTLVSQGRMQEAELLIEDELERARAQGVDHGAALAALLVGRGELRYERNDLEGARRDIEEALVHARSVGDAKILMNVYVAQSLLEQAQGAMDEALRAIQRATRVFNGPMERAWNAWLALKRGDLATVRRWMEEYRADVGNAPELGKGEIEQVIYGRALIASGQAEQGVAYLSALLREADATGRHGRTVTIRLVLAQHADAAGEPASELLAPVLDLATRERYARSFLDEGPALLSLLRRVVRTDPSPERRQFVTSLLAPERHHADGPVASPAVALVEPLTQRQREILQLLVAGQSNRAIADALFLSEGTIKAHVHQIFGKLMVRTRAEAIRAAHEHHLA